MGSESIMAKLASPLLDAWNWGRKSSNTVLDSRRNFGMIGINQPLSTVRIHKRQVQEDDEMIEVNYDSPEEKEGEGGYRENDKIFTQPDFENEVDSTSQNAQEVIDDQDEENGKLAADIFDGNESSVELIVSKPTIPIVATPKSKRSRDENPKPKDISYGETQRKKRSSDY